MHGHAVKVVHEEIGGVSDAAQLGLARTRCFFLVPVVDRPLGLAVSRPGFPVEIGDCSACDTDDNDEGAPWELLPGPGATSTHLRISPAGPAGPDQAAAHERVVVSNSSAGNWSMFRFPSLST
jgi:hypothetical protein